MREGRRGGVKRPKGRGKDPMGVRGITLRRKEIYEEWTPRRRSFILRGFAPQSSFGGGPADNAAFSVPFLVLSKTPIRLKTHQRPSGERKRRGEGPGRRGGGDTSVGINE